jgi:hypothetical protein
VLEALLQMEMEMEMEKYRRSGTKNCRMRPKNWKYIR